MSNDIVKKVEDNLSTFNSLGYFDKKFVVGITLGEKNKKELVKEIYRIEDDEEAEIKIMTTLARKEINDSINEFNAIQTNLFKAKILSRSGEALDKQVDIMRDGLEEANQLKAASNISKLGLDIVKEENKKNENKTMRIIVENSGSVNINFGSEQISKSFIPKEEDIIEGEIVIEEIEEVE